MRGYCSIALFLVADLFLLLALLMVSFASPTQRQLTIDPAVGGTTIPPPGVYTYGFAVNVTITAVPDSSYIFDYWMDGSGHFMGNSNPIMQTMYSNLTLQPVFENLSSAKRVLTINAVADGITNPSPGEYTYPYGANVTVTAIPDQGCIFDFWKGQNGNFMGGSNPIMLMMDYNMTLQPVFENASTAKRTLTIRAGSNGTTNPPAGNYTYAYGENVTVTAISATGYIFTQWTDPFGNVMGFQNPDMLTMTWNFTIQPVFENASTAKRTLTINAATGGTTSPPPGTYTYAYGANVTVTAIPNPGYIFDFWKSGSWIMGNQNPNMLTMFQNMTLQPLFENASTAKRTLTLNAAIGGTTNPPPGNYTYPYGANVTVTAIPNSGYVFDHWVMGSGGNFGNQNPLKVMLNWNSTIQPAFENATSGSRTLTIFPAGNGTTDPPPGTYTYNYGTNVTITATPISGQSFEHWILDGETVNGNRITLQMTQDHTLQPVFTSGQGGFGQGFNLNIPSMFILVPAVVVIACCFVGYLAPLGLAIRRGKVPPSVKKPRLILALVSILIVVGPLGATLFVYSGNLSGVVTPSNTNKLTNMLSNHGGISMPNVTSSWCNLTSRTFCLLFNFTNPTATALTLIACSANLTDHSDRYPLGQITLANPVTAGANETVTFQMTSTLTEEAAEHVSSAHAGSSSFDVDLSGVNVNYAGIILHMNGTSTVSNVLILR
jgi:hypothetical protein